MSLLVNPDDFIIARKRKKYKFAKFSNAKNCFEFEEWHGQAVDVIELGAGTAVFLLELAKRHPEKTFAAIDVKADRLQYGAYAALEQHVENIVFIRARADQIDELFPEQSIAALWLTFSDPFPRDRSKRRRMTHPLYLEKYRSIMRLQSALFIKHDDTAFFHWSLEQLVTEHWRIAEISFDLHESELSDEYKIKTSYEEKWLSEGRITSFVKALVKE